MLWQIKPEKFFFFFFCLKFWLIFDWCLQDLMIKLLQMHSIAQQRIIFLLLLKRGSTSGNKSCYNPCNKTTLIPVWLWETFFFFFIQCNSVLLEGSKLISHGRDPSSNLIHHHAFLQTLYNLLANLSELDTGCQKTIQNMCIWLWTLKAFVFRVNVKSTKLSIRKADEEISNW